MGLMMTYHSPIVFVYIRDCYSGPDNDVSQPYSVCISGTAIVGPDDLS